MSSAVTSLRRLSRATDARPAAPVRIVHLGVGNFFRAHQAWYTEHSDDAADWGIAAFTGHSRRVADELAAQDGLYTLLVRHDSASVPEVVASLSAVHTGSELGALRDYLASADVVVVTVTVTETLGFYRTSGLIDDTRAFCSIPARHDMSRRLDSAYLAELVVEHRLDEDEAFETGVDLVTTIPRQVFRL